MFGSGLCQSNMLCGECLKKGHLPRHGQEAKTGRNWACISLSEGLPQWPKLFPFEDFTNSLQGHRPLTHGLWGGGAEVTIQSMGPGVQCFQTGMRTWCQIPRSVMSSLIAQAPVTPECVGQDRRWRQGKPLEQWVSACKW